MACNLRKKINVQSKFVLSSFAAIHTEVYTLRNSQEINRLASLNRLSVGCGTTPRKGCEGLKSAATSRSLGHVLINTDLQWEVAGGA